jgi:hypothetical protein
LQKPEVEQTVTSTIGLVNQMIPLMTIMMMFQLMMGFTSMFREIIPKREKSD